MSIGSCFQPLLILRNGKEVDALLPFCDLWRNHELLSVVDTRYKTSTYANNRSDKLDEEIRQLQQRGEEVIQEVDQKTFDMRAIVILLKIS